MNVILLGIQYFRLAPELAIFNHLILINFI